MKIIDVRVRYVSSDLRLKGVVIIIFEDVFVVYDIWVIEGENGLFVVMFSKKMLNGGFRDIVYLIYVDMCK